MTPMKSTKPPSYTAITSKDEIYLNWDNKFSILISPNGTISAGEACGEIGNIKGVINYLKQNPK